jgi:predicted NBD/HSP70 family sugar kinase
MTAGAPGGARVATPQLLRRMNAERVLDELRRGGRPLRVSDLVTRTRLSRPTVDAVADDLIRLGWAIELEEDRASGPQRGRPARRLAFRADAGYVAGLDIGERSLRAAVADLRGDVVAALEQPFTEPEDDGAGRLARVRRAAAATLEAAGVGREHLLAASIGCTGAMDAATGRVLFSSAFPGLSDLNLADALRGSLGDTVVVENDCNLAVVAERWRGAAQGVEDVICVLGSERLGAGIVVSGRLVRGHAGAAGEMAFLGAYEEEHGAAGVARIARTMAGRAFARGEGRDGALWSAVGGDPARADAEAIFAAAAAGDPLAEGIVEQALHSAGRAIATMALVLNPELVVIGGGVARAGDALIAPLRRRLEEMARLPPRLEASPLAEQGVVLGAIRHALDHVEPRALDRLHEAA